MTIARSITSGAATFVAATLLASPAQPAQHAHLHDEETAPAGSDLGIVEFSASCSEGQSQRFDHALALMHHMMYAQARSEFETIAEADPECAMARWGIATTLFQPLWPTRPSERDLQRGRREIERAQQMAAADSRERLLIDATAAFFRDSGKAEYWERIERWAAGMSEAYKAHRDDLDVASLYALSRLALALNADDRDTLHDEAEDILRRVWEEQPRHPGAVHYTIHATDADGRAENALDIVESYRDIAPEVPHALHMPTHIYVRLGDWDKVIEWNERSADAALKGPVDGAISHHYLHAIDYLVYAHLQKGQDEAAVSIFEEARDKGRHQASFISAFHMAAIPARLAIERERWEDATSLEPGEPDYLPWESTYWPPGLTWFARGLGGVKTGDLNLSRESERKLRELAASARADGEEKLATNIEIERRILAGWLAHAEGDADRALRLVRSAAELEGTIEKPPVSPGAIMPPYEAMGRILMELDRPAEALKAFEASNDIWPGRYRTLVGAAQAARMAGEEQQAREYYSELLETAGDSSREKIAEARNYDGASPGR